MYVIVDVETTGGVGGNTRIIEIALFLHDGRRVVDHYQTLLNPQAYIPSFITHLTGITNEMVADAPLFEEVSDQIRAMTKDAWFVAHNAAFDYGFVKKEFSWLDEYFVRDTLCTVRLSRKIFPGFPSYSLPKLCVSLGIPHQQQHRAAGDAQATVGLFERLLRHDTLRLIPFD
jgi:DNA polymerase-3 subunit epsilon